MPARPFRMMSTSVAGQTIEVTGTLEPDGRAFRGTYAISGGCGNASRGAVTGRRVTLDGVWVASGSDPKDGSPYTVTMDLKVGDLPYNETGAFALSGPVRGTWTRCLTEAVVSRGGRGRALFPDFLTTTGTLLAEFWAEADDAVPAKLHFWGTFMSGPCSPELVSWVFTRKAGA